MVKCAHVCDHDNNFYGRLHLTYRIKLVNLKLTNSNSLDDAVRLPCSLCGVWFIAHLKWRRRERSKLPIAIVAMAAFVQVSFTTAVANAANLFHNSV